MTCEFTHKDDVVYLPTNKRDEAQDIDFLFWLLDERDSSDDLEFLEHMEHVLTRVLRRIITSFASCSSVVEERRRFQEKYFARFTGAELARWKGEFSQIVQDLTPSGGSTR